MEIKSLEEIESESQPFQSAMTGEQRADVLTQAIGHYHLTKFNAALSEFQKISSEAWEQGHVDTYIECLSYMIRILLEKERREELLYMVSMVQYVIEKRAVGPEILSRAHYTLGVINLSFPQGAEIAKTHFERAIEVSVGAKDYRGLCYAVYGVAGLYNQISMGNKCLVELEKLEQILFHHPIPEIKSASLLLRAFVTLDQESEPLKALPFLHAACEQLRNQPNIYLFIQCLFGFGSVHLKANDFSSAQVHLELAKALCSSEELPRMNKLILATLEVCRSEMAIKTKNSLVFDFASATVERLGVGTISLNSQFLLRDLLALFLENPGKVFSKEELVQSLWKEEYSPLHHDNKIYVTLKRLRQVLEPLFPEMDPILRGRDGYTLNQKLMARIVKGVK